MKKRDTKDREKRKQDKKRRPERVRAARKGRLERVLAALGLLRGFRDLPSNLRETAINGFAGPPEVVVPPDAGAVGIRLKELLEEPIREGVVSTETGKSIPMSDFLSVCPLALRGFSSLVPVLRPGEHRSFAARAAEVLGEFLKGKIGEAFNRCCSRVTTELMRINRIDRFVVGCRMEPWRGRPEDPVLKWILECSDPRETRVVINGKARPAFRCGLPHVMRGIKWMECDGSVLGFEGGRSYPVYLQSHALRRLRERFSCSKYPEFCVNFGLRDSLNDVTTFERRGDDFLIGFHIHGIRVGYLAARRVGDLVVITTFLLLTMEGTPEGRLLRQNLGLTRPDIEYGRFDRLETFLDPGVLADKELVRVLEDSGCKSLLDLGRDGFPHEVMMAGRAEELKRFLGITGLRGGGPSSVTNIE